MEKLSSWKNSKKSDTISTCHKMYISYFAQLVDILSKKKQVGYIFKTKWLLTSKFIHDVERVVPFCFSAITWLQLSSTSRYKLIFYNIFDNLKRIFKNEFLNSKFLKELDLLKRNNLTSSPQIDIQVAF